MAGRTNDTRRYYNSKTIDEALTVLQGHWPNRTRSKKDARQQGRKKSRVISPLWIEDDLGGRVGVKVMVLVTHLIYRYVSTESLKISKLSVVNDGPDFDAKTLSDVGFKGSSQSFRKTLSPLASENNLSKKDYDHRRDKLAFCCFAFKAKRAIDRLEGSESDEAVTIAQANDLYEKIASARCDTAQEVFRIIEASWLQGLQYLEPEEENDDDEPAEHTDTSGSHSIPDKLAHYLPPNGKFQKNRNPSEIIDIAERILQQFDTVKERLALIYGKVNAGKSGCVVELLRSLCDRDSETIGLSLKPSETDEAVLLPVFTVSVQDHTGYEMLLLVLAFLERCGQTPKQRKEFDFKKRVKDLASDYGDELDPGAVDKVKAKIRELHHDQPVLFILTNWEDLIWSTPRAQLRDQSKTSLISLLHDSNTLSRFVITTTTTPNRRAKRGLPKYRKFEVKDPRLQHINRYLPNLKIPPCYENALFEAVERLDGAAVPGDHLILIASALELCRDTQQWEQRAIEALGELEAENYRGPVVVAPHQFVKLLVERLDNLDLFRIVMAIIASEDGLRPSSLRRLMRDWDHDAGRKLNRVGDAVDKGLKHVEGLANTFFLRKRNINPINVTQFSPLEKQMAEEESWEIYETLRQTILTALTDPCQQDWAAPYSLLLREATRHVAKLAFDRAQEWRARTVYANLTPWWQDLLLDIQALEALLASVDPEKLESKKTNQDQKWAFPLLHHATDVIFTCRDTHAPAVAVRFAVVTLLIDTVDVDNRMSMCYDQDLMRMRLYMLPFLGVGQRHFERLDDKTLDDLPKSIPGWMRGVFSDEEIMRLLEAVAISALHSQAADVVRWAWERTSDVIDAAVADGANRQDLIKRTTRTYCSTIDMGIQRGFPLDDKKGSNPGRVGHECTLDQLDIFIEQTFPDFNGTEAVAAQEPSLLDPDMIEAIGRLRVRRAHLLGLLGKLAEAEEEFSAIHAWEITLARASGSGRPEILEGRPARVAMQIMMRGELMLQHQTERRKDIAKRLRGMLSANNARLTRFGGAEQAAVLVDRSRFAFVNGDPDLAYEYAAEARQFCDDNRVSYGMQIHILLNLVAILIECSESTRAKESKDRLLNRNTIDLAERDADAVYHTAKALTLRPTEGVALYLRARLQHLRNVLHPDVPPNAGRPDSSKKDIGDAILIMQKCADQSFRQGMEHLRDLLGPPA